MADTKYLPLFLLPTNKAPNPPFLPFPPTKPPFPSQVNGLDTTSATLQTPLPNHPPPRAPPTLPQQPRAAPTHQKPLVFKPTYCALRAVRVRAVRDVSGWGWRHMGCAWDTSALGLLCWGWRAGVGYWWGCGRSGLEWFDSRGKELM